MADSLHVAMFTDFHPDTLGGVQTAQRALCDGLRRLGHRVTVFCPPAPGSTTPDGDTVLLRTTRFTMSNGLPVALPTRANRRLVDTAFAARGPVDIVHALTTYGCGIAGARAARRHGVPVVQTMQSRDDLVIEKYSTAPLPAALTMRLLHGWFVPLDRRPTAVGDGRVARLAWRPLIAQAQAADRVVVPTAHFARRLTDRGVDRPIHVVSNGIDDALLDRVRDVPATGSAPDAPLRVLWCGRLSTEKRPLEAIEVIRRVDNATLDVYGSGPLTADARAAVADAELSRRVQLHGEVDQAACLHAMRTHDLLLLTSDCDTQGMVLLEAVAMGLPILYCDPELAETVPVTGGIRASDPSVESFTDTLRSIADERERLHAARAALAAHADDPRQSRHIDRVLAVYTAALTASAGPSRRS
ncbi:glycosyltransferase [Nocardia sp. CC227C]|uniref:glycosyltransferase n=1 Tax=Nocardia sp. CC227C TaxID=3044562 RepID=UPI00278C4C59|nr:glycosyltransferase [Nocardia sp. CC227C]